MPIVAYRKRIVRKRRRRFVPRKRIFKAKSLIPRRTIYIHKGRFRLFKHRDPMPRVFKRFNTYIMPRGPRKSYAGTVKPKKKAKILSPWALQSIAKKWQSQWNRGKRVWGPILERGEQPPDWEENAWQRERKKSFKDKHKTSLADMPTKKINPSWFKRGEKPPARAYKNYGPMRRLGPDQVIMITPTVELMKVAKRLQGRYKQGWLTDNIKTTIDNLRKKLLEHAEMIINIYVPKDSGDLRASMLKELNRRHRMGYRLEMRIGTPMMGRNNMTYAGPVQNMPERMLRHPHKTRLRGRAVLRMGKDGTYLNDPKAQHDSYKHIRMKLNNHLVRVLLPAFYEKLTRDAVKKTGIGLIPRVPRRIGSSHEEYLKEKARTQTERFAKFRQKKEKIQDNDKLKKVQYGLRDVKGWFKVELPFKK